MVETKRLILKPMNAEELDLNINDPKALDKMWGLNSVPSRVPEVNKHVRCACESRIEMIKKHPDSYLWYTNWAIISKEDSAVIGGIMIISDGEKEGEVEFGYGTDPDYQNHGYMTEAVGALVDWAFNNSDRDYIIAETDKDNTASHKVLIKNGFEKYVEVEEGFWWRVNRSK